MRAIITGAASGIGRAAALRLASDAVARGGGSFVLVDLSEGGLAKVAGEVQALGAAAHVLAQDLSDPQAATAAAALAERELGALDALVSNAGRLLQGTPLIDTALDDYDNMFAVNTRATWLLAKACRPMLRQSSGAIVATASISAREPTPMLGPYSATKAALVMLVRQLAYELGPEGIRCNCVSPGSTRTGINDWLLDDPAVRQAREAFLPLGRIGAPEDLAAGIAFLVGPDAAYITGADLWIDGGLNATLMPSLASLPAAGRGGG